MTTDDRLKFTLTREEALRFVDKHKPGRKLFVRGAAFLPTSDGKGFQAICNVPVSQRVAHKYINDMLNVFDKRGAKIEVHLMENCLFIG